MFNTIPNNPFPPSSEQMGAGGGSYVLPVASADTLGGIKVGNNLSIDDGVLSAPAPYTPPAYSTTEQNTGIKWIDGKYIYCKVIVLTNAINVNGNSWVEHVDNIAGETCLSVQVMNTSGYCFMFGGGFNNGDLEIVNLRSSVVENVKTIICSYTKATT